jgi:Na+/proline symporter
MTHLDWSVVVLYFALSAGVGLYFARRAGRGVEEFFLSGRNLPWWLAGTSMVATTFAADTPLAVTEMVARNGIAGNWIWWNAVFGGMLTVFLFARLWRRAGILTDVELVELRYSGRPAAFLRGFRALYVGLALNCVIMGWVNLAMGTILSGMFGIPKEEVLRYVALAMVITAGYSALSGLWGVAVTDALQFLLAMAGTIVLAFVVLALPQIGGVAGLKAKLPEHVFEFAPVIGGAPAGGGVLALTLAAFLAYVAVQWWASWYPGAEPGGGGYVVQRMMSAKDEKHSLFATLWFTIAHYCLRPWPWILVGLATLVLYPELGHDVKREGYVHAMRDFLPAGLKGLLVAAFFAAYMSTIATHLNWGTSYVIHDFYRRFVKREAGERHLVLVSRVATLVLMVISLSVTWRLETITGAWEFILETGAGVGLVLILRWFWWRVSAWSEITAMVVAAAASAVVTFGTDLRFPMTLYPIVAVTTLAWLAVTFLTRPTDAETLRGFFRRCHPGGPGWTAVARDVPEVEADTGLRWLFLDWAAGVVLVYSALFAVGRLIFGDYTQGLLLAAVAALAAGIIYWDVSRRGFKVA